MNIVPMFIATIIKNSIHSKATIPKKNRHLLDCLCNIWPVTLCDRFRPWPRTM